MKSPDFKHEVALVDIRHKLQELEGFGYYLTENELQSGLYDVDDYDYNGFVNLNSDGFLNIKVNDGNYFGAIEYERFDKGKTRYKPLFREYYRRDEISFVFYFVGTSEVMNTILRVDRDVRSNQESKIYCIELSKAMESKDKMSLINSNSGVLDLKIKPRKTV